MSNLNAFSLGKISVAPKQSCSCLTHCWQVIFISLDLPDDSLSQIIASTAGTSTAGFTSTVSILGTRDAMIELSNNPWLERMRD